VTIGRIAEASFRRRSLENCSFRGAEPGQDLIDDLNQALKARTFKGILGPLAYRLLT